MKVAAASVNLFIGIRCHGGVAGARTMFRLSECQRRVPVVREDNERPVLRWDSRLGADLNGHQLRGAPSSFDGFDGIFCC